mgnify:CR=1 FL=1
MNKYVKASLFGLAIFFTLITFCDATDVQHNGTSVGELMMGCAITAFTWAIWSAA